MLDSRLVGKKLDVRVMGTASIYKGRYENQCGFITMTETPADLYASTTVRIGFEESRRSFPIGYLHPQTTTERPPFVVAKDAVALTSQLGQRVVIIGPDIEGSTQLIGQYCYIVHSGHSLPVGLALVERCISGDDGKCSWGYFNEGSICRSHPV